MVYPTFHTIIHQPVQLTRYIDRLVIYHFLDDEVIPFVPEGQFDLILQSDRDILYQSDYTNGWVTRPKLFVGGLHNRAYSIKPTQKNTRLISIQFKPNCTKHFLPDKLHFYKNQIINLQDVFPRRQLEILENIDTEKDFQKVIRILESFLISTFKERALSPIDAALPKLCKNGFIRIDQLASQAGISAPQFRKRFREEIGMSPKEYSKIVRINKITRHLKNRKSLGKLTDLAYQLGYFDQSHLIKDFQSVIGTSPKKFLADTASFPTQQEELQYQNSVRR